MGCLDSRTLSTMSTQATKPTPITFRLRPILGQYIVSRRNVAHCCHLLSSRLYLLVILRKNNFPSSHFPRVYQFSTYPITYTINNAVQKNAQTHPGIPSQQHQPHQMPLRQPLRRIHPISILMHSPGRTIGGRKDNFSQLHRGITPLTFRKCNVAKNAWYKCHYLQLG